MRGAAEERIQAFIKDKRSLLCFAILVIAIVCLLFYEKGHESYVPSSVSALTPPPVPAEHPQFQFEVVRTEADQERGLGGRAEVPGNYGMLFVFPNDDEVGFWMKDMLVPIDIIWLSDTGSIVGIEDSVSPDTYPNVFYPPEPVRYVLETKAGEARRQGWTIGTLVPIPLQS